LLPKDINRSIIHCILLDAVYSTTSIRRLVALYTCSGLVIVIQWCRFLSYLSTLSLPTSLKQTLHISLILLGINLSPSFRHTPTVIAHKHTLHRLLAHVPDPHYIPHSIEEPATRGPGNTNIVQPHHSHLEGPCTLHEAPERLDDPPIAPRAHVVAIFERREEPGLDLREAMRDRAVSGRHDQVQLAQARRVADAFKQVQDERIGIRKAHAVPVAQRPD